MPCPCGFQPLGDPKNGQKNCINDPRKVWVIVKDTHEALVSREDWNRCCNMVDRKSVGRTTKNRTILPLSGLIICPDCGSSFHYGHSTYITKSGENHTRNHYNCGTFVVGGKSACPSHHIPEQKITEIIINDIKEKAKDLAIDDEIFRKKYCEKKIFDKKKITDDNKKNLKRLRKRLEELSSFIQGAFEEKIKGKMSEDIFDGLIMKYEAEKDEIVDKIQALEKIREYEIETESDVDKFVRLMKENIDIKELDRKTAVTLIDHITVSARETNPREVVIYYNFVGNIS